MSKVEHVSRLSSFLFRFRKENLSYNRCESRGHHKKRHLR